MSEPIALLRGLPIEAFETPKPGDAWARSPLAMADDAVLIRAVAGAIACPKLAINSSFLLHAPLELLARATLLPHVPPRSREGARRRIAEIAARYAAGGSEIEPTPKSYSTDDAALAELSEALRGGEAAAVDSALLFLTPRISVDRLRTMLAAPILPLLGAAGHAPILMMQMQSPASRFPECAPLLRSPLRAIALQSDRCLRWIDAPGEPAETQGLFECLAAPPHVEAPSQSIAATMLAAERDGYAARILSAATRQVTVPAARRILLRVAALSMLLDDQQHAPYGWTHCFTLPQAILSLVDAAPDATRVIRIAATYCLGFRATLGSARLPIAGNASGPADAAAGVFKTGAGHPPQALRAQLVERAAIHADAHLVKYTVACLAAADSDPQESALYLAAAAHLGDWWDRRQGRV